MKKKLNVVDYILIVAVILIIGVVGYKKLAVDKSAGIGVQASHKAIEYTMDISGIRQFSVDGFHVGDKIYDKNKGTYMGIIKDISVEPHKLDKVDVNGDSVLAEVKGYYKVILTVEGEMVDKDNGYFLSGNLELKVNSEYRITTKYIETTGVVKGLTVQ